MKIIVTGCNGRLGQAACELLLGAGHVVVGIDAVAMPDRPHRVVVETLMNPFALHRALDLLGGQADGLVHLANHINALVAPPEVVLRENGAMNTSVFMAAWQAGIPRVVFASSIQAMLGGHETDGQMNQRVPAKLPIDETFDTRPTNVYGLSKVLAEKTLDHLCCAERFHRPSGFTAVSLRLPFILHPKGFEASVVKQGLTDYMWGGSECFAYIAREDAAEGVRAALETPTAGHEVVWMAAPDPRVPEPVAQLVGRFYSKTPGVDECLRRDSFMNCDKAQRIFGWKATRIMREERARRGLAPVMLPT